MLQALGVSNGIGIAPAFLWQAPIPYAALPRQCTNKPAEIKHFEAAKAAVLQKNQRFSSSAARRIGSAEASIFDAHCELLLDDEGIVQPVVRLINEQNYSAEHAVMQHFGAFAAELLALENEYMRQRAEDIFSLRDQLLREMLGLPAMDASHFDTPTVVVAHLLSPADMAGMDLSRLQGIICEAGGYSSHVAILARTLGIPAVVGAEGIVAQTHKGCLMALDGGTGEVWVNPTTSELAMLRRRCNTAHSLPDGASSYRGVPTLSLDGHRIELSANAGQTAEVDAALENDCESIGLYRSELLYANHGTPPNEETQLSEYRNALEKLRGKALTVRTLDSEATTGNLTPLEHHGENPALGHRGIRMSLDNPKILHTQLRALLRASAWGSVRIMLPMVTFLSEVDKARAALENAKKELRREGLPFDEKIPLGVMVEVPGTAMLAPAFAQKADFFTIGINDLVQFTTAVDRTNRQLAPLYGMHHPAVLRLIQLTVQGAHKAGISCNLCGEVPSLEKTLPLLFGLELDGFSLNPSHILPARRVLNNCIYQDCRALAAAVLQTSSTTEAEELLAEWTERHPLP